MRTALSLVALTTLALASSACSQGASGTCASSRDCLIGEVCVSGACTPTMAKQKCTSDQNCEVGQVCIDSACVEMPEPISCSDDTMCPPTQRCNTLTGVCIDRGPATQCTDQSQCAPNEVCVSGTCMPNNTGGCTADSQCSPPSEICMGGACVLGCGQPNGMTCSGGDVCDTRTGRCVSIRGPCSADTECNPPQEVCELGQCIPGCTEFGGVQCPGGQQCNPNTGRCVGVGDVCLSDLECNSPSETCNLVSGACEPGCGSRGCTAPDTCDAASGHCVGSRTCSADRLEPNDTFANGSAGGGLQTGLTLCPGDVDFHRFTLGAGDDITVTADFVHGEGNIDLELVNSSGTVLAMSNTTGNTETIRYTASAAGDHAVRAFLRQDLGPTPGNTYSINIGAQAAPCTDDSYEENDSSLLPPLVTPGMVQGLNVCTGDDDYYDVFVAAGETITVNVRFTHSEGDIDLALLGLFDIPLRTSATSNDVESVTYTANNDGLFTILVNLFQDAGSMPGNPYTMEVTITPAMQQVCAADALEENDTRAAARTITAGQHQNLNTCTDDEDFYAVALQANQQINATVSFTNGEGDIDLELLDGSGAVVASSGSTGNSENVTRTVTAAGTYYLRVFLYRDNGSTNGNSYSLNLQVSGGAPQCTADQFEPNDSLATARTMAMGTYANLGACTDDDYFGIALTSGQSINVNVDFTHAEGDIDLEIYGPNGQVAARSETTGNNENIAGTANVSGTFVIRVFLYADTGSTPGNTYQLSVSP